MKRYISYLITALLIAALLCGCGDTMNGGTSATSNPVPTAQSTMPALTPNVTSSPEPNGGVVGGLISPDVSASMTPSASPATK